MLSLNTFSYISNTDLFNKFIEQHEAKLDPKYPTDFVDLYLVEKQRARPSFQVGAVQRFE